MKVAFELGNGQRLEEVGFIIEKSYIEETVGGNMNVKGYSSEGSEERS